MIESRPRTCSFVVLIVLAACALKTADAHRGSIASLTALSRVYHDDHWISDSFLGSAIGAGVGLAVVRLHANNRNGYTLRLVPSAGGITAALVF